MCGRFTLTLPSYEDLARLLGVSPMSEPIALHRPRFNIAPTDPHWRLRDEAGRRALSIARWGLVPHWAEDASGAARLIHARSETARTKATFREAFERRRCVVPADGFFEWSGAKSARKPLWFHAQDGGLLLFAGLHDAWKSPTTGAWLQTFTILTTAANDVVAIAHDRMPAILAPSEVDAWIGANDAAIVQALLRPAPRERLAARAVSTRVNAVQHDDPSCIAPAAAEDPMASLGPLFAPRAGGRG